jgi:hypothetical protein
MSTPPNPLTPAAPSPAPSIWSRIATYLPAVAAHLAAAAGNYTPLDQLNRQYAISQRWDELRNQHDLLNSNLQTADLARQREQKELDTFQSPEQKQAMSIDTAGKLGGIHEQYAEPKLITGPTEGGQLGYFQQDFDPNSKQWNITPAMVTKQVPNPTQAPGADMPAPIGGQPLLKPAGTIAARQQLMAMPKPSGGLVVEPDPHSSTGYSHVSRDAFGNEIFRSPNALPPAAFVPSSTSGSTNTLKQDQNGNWVTISEPHSSTKTPSVPWLRTSQPGGSDAAPAPTPNRSSGSGPRASLVVNSDGTPLHAPLSADAKKSLRQISTSDQMLNAVLPDLTAAVKDMGHGSNLYDATQTRSAWLQYNQLGLDPNNVDPNSIASSFPNVDPRIAKIFPAISMMKVVLAQPFMANSRNFQFMQQIQQHVPDPEKDTPQLMLSKAQWIKQSLPMIKRAVYESEGVGAAPQSNTAAPQGNTVSLQDFLREK